MHQCAYLFSSACIGVWMSSYVPNLVVFSEVVFSEVVFSEAVFSEAGFCVRPFAAHERL